MKNSFPDYDGQHQQRRPTMISARYRQREERRRVLKISANKLRKIEDPEASLCRSVLINNTMRQLQRETSCSETGRPHVRTRPDPTPPTDLAIDTDECDVLLSHLYMPPTPRMLTSIDDDDGLLDDNVHPAKRARFDEQLPSQQQQPPALLGSMSCGRASLLGELHGPVFRSLVASLET